MRPALLFDGDCGFCTAAAGRARRLARGRVDVVPWQAADLPSLGLTPEQCGAALQWVDAAGSRSGARAVAALLRHRGGPWRVVGALLGAPGIGRLGDLAYDVVARNRSRLPGTTPACRLPGER